MNDPQQIQLDKNDIENLIEVWKILEVLTVSLDRIGSAEAISGEGKGQKQNYKFLKAKIYWTIFSTQGNLLKFPMQEAWWRTF